MQDGLAAGITHSRECRVLSDVAAFNPFAESDYISALHELQDVNFSFLAKLKSNKDASIETLMNILRLEEPIAERLGLQESQSHEDQLMVPIHHSPDQTVMDYHGLSVTFASVRSTLPISMDDYEIAHAEDQGNTGVDVDPFPNVDDAELIIS
ncbi:hypothetical protein Tco_0023325 [Tanacetum coccineum]